MAAMLAYREDTTEKPRKKIRNSKDAFRNSLVLDNLTDADNAVRHGKLGACRILELANLLGIDRADLVQSARIGLIQAAERFDTERGEFSTYAGHWMRSEIGRHIASQGNGVKINTRIALSAEIIGYLHSTELAIEFIEKNGRILNETELKKLERISRKAAEMVRYLMPVGGDDRKLRSAKEKVEELKTALREARDAKSLDHPVNGNGSHTKLGDLIPDRDSSNNLDNRVYIHQLLERLERTKQGSLKHQILYLRMCGRETLKEIGDRFGLSFERVRQLEQAALADLRRFARIDKIKVERCLAGNY